MTDQAELPKAGLPKAGRGARGSVRKRRGRGWLLAGVALLAAGGIAAWGIVGRADTVSALTQRADDESVPKVTLVSPQHGPSIRTVTLPGQTQAWYQAPIFAQVTGYVQAWYKDYGADVRKGELLATIATPNLDQELEQARAQLQVVKGKYALAQVTAARWQKLAGTQAVSQQTVDVNNADARAAQAEVQAAQFNVGRFESQESFKQVVAPFDGVVTSRNTDTGNFVNAAGGNAGQQGGTQELFSVADVHQIRVFVSVPQDYAGYIKPGLTASMTMPQFPDRTFKVDVTTTAKSFNSASRTVVTELTLPNPKEEIWPGAYADVRFQIPTDPNILIVPEQALLFRAQGLQVALVQDGKVHLQNIKLGLNLGETVQVMQGLKPTDQLIANPSDGLLEGQAVDVVQVPPQNSDDEPQAGASNASHSAK